MQLLWKTAFHRLGLARPVNMPTFKQQEQMLDELYYVLLELKERGNQLTLLTEHHAGESRYPPA
jgi:hypothetical protein